MIHPIVMLASGLRVMNFSSPHSFTFDTKEVLPGCEPEVSKALMLETTEVVSSGQSLDRAVSFQVITLSFRMSEAVKSALLAAREAKCDVILVPLPVLQALSAYLSNAWEQAEADRPTYRGAPQDYACLSAEDMLISEVSERCFVCRVVDRVAKTISSTKFCQ